MTSPGRRYTEADVRIEDRGQYLYAHSPDIPGLHIAAESPEELNGRIGPAIKMLYKLNKDIDVEVVDAA